MRLFHFIILSIFFAAILILAYKIIRFESNIDEIQLKLKGANEELNVVSTLMRNHESKLRSLTSKLKNYSIKNDSLLKDRDALISQYRKQIDNYGKILNKNKKQLEILNKNYLIIKAENELFE